MYIYITNIKKISIIFLNLKIRNQGLFVEIKKSIKTYNIRLNLNYNHN